MPSAYMRRKALSAAYGEHVLEWRRWRWRESLEASRARDEEIARRMVEELKEREAETEEVLAELREDLGCLR